MSRVGDVWTALTALVWSWPGAVALFAVVVTAVYYLAAETALRRQQED